MTDLEKVAYRKHSAIAEKELGNLEIPKECLEFAHDIKALAKKKNIETITVKYVSDGIKAEYDIDNVIYTRSAVVNYEAGKDRLDIHMVYKSKDHTVMTMRYVL